MYKNHKLFYVFSSDPGQGGRANGPPVLYQIRQNPYSQRTVWGIIEVGLAGAGWSRLRQANPSWAGPVQALSSQAGPRSAELSKRS